MNELVAWYCGYCCKRREQKPSDKYCPDCGDKMQRCSRYEWFLFDAISDLLDEQLGNGGREYRLEAQYPVHDHRGFDWYFDLFVWVKGKSSFGGYGELIEINGSTHDNQPKYSGRGGGYTRDYDKHWEVFSNQRLHKRGIDYRVLSNEECSMRNVKNTANKLVAEIIKRADSWC